ncbi:MAG: hypothetical protein HYY52_02180 [Candidatus Melainabacteria bacterium]|nr:hypothetical protein [Candidatus Melainabacteria bacterium]
MSLGVKTFSEDLQKYLLPAQYKELQLEQIKEYQLLFYKALAQNPTPRFKPYLEELKKILGIS